ncbi:MAG: hypothetical protein WD883_02430 [Candidatus Colwellbacteria bacterium]
MKKLFKKPEFKLALLVSLIVLCAYGIGYIMGYDSSRAPIIIEKVSS